MACHSNASEASRKLQIHLDEIQKWLRKWRIKANETKSVHVTFTLKRETCPQVYINRKPLPQVECVRYLGLHLDRRLTWRPHIFNKRKQLGLKLTKLLWLLGRNSKLSLENKLCIYKVILKPIWTYGIQLWGSAAKTNIDILQRFQSKVLRMIVEAPWFVSNETIHRDLKVCYVHDEIKKCSEKYLKRLEIHPNSSAVNLLDNSMDIRRLKRFKP